MISQVEVWWADRPEPTGSRPGFRRPIIVVQCDDLNRSRLPTVVCVPLTSNLKYADTTATSTSPPAPPASPKTPSPTPPK
jgi:mRNA-degrading endonuclease toxin of MazEF toxin-antitoxin module